MFNVFSFISVYFLVGACGSLSFDQPSKSNQEKVSEYGLLYTATDLQFQSSQLFHLAEEKESEALLSGSGDFVLFQDEGYVFAFNRKAEDLNFRRILAESSSEGWAFAPEKQLAIEGQVVGDPHDVKVIDRDRMLIANYVGGSLAVVNFRTGELVDHLKADWDVGENGQLRAQSMHAIGDDTFVILHQGYDKIYQLNGSQQLFWVQWRGEKLVAVDLDEGTDGIQGVKLHGSLPSGLFPLSDDRLATVAVCYAASQECQSSVDIVNLQDKSVLVKVELDNAELLYNGNPIASNKEGVLYMNARLGKNAEAAVVKISVEEEKIERVFSYPASSVGIWSLAYDRQKGALMIADARGSSGGIWTILDEGEDSVVIETKQVPFSSLFVDFSQLAD